MGMCFLMRSVSFSLLCLQACMSNAMATMPLVCALRYSRIPVARLAFCLVADVARGNSMQSKQKHSVAKKRV